MPSSGRCAGTGNAGALWFTPDCDTIPHARRGLGLGLTPRDLTRDGPNSRGYLFPNAQPSLLHPPAVVPALGYGFVTKRVPVAFGVALAFRKRGFWGRNLV